MNNKQNLNSLEEEGLDLLTPIILTLFNLLSLALAFAFWYSNLQKVNWKFREMDEKFFAFLWTFLFLISSPAVLVGWKSYFRDSSKRN